MTIDNEKKPEDIAALCETVRDRLAQHPELLAMLHRNGRPLSRAVGVNVPPVQTLGTTLMLGTQEGLVSIDFPIRLNGNAPIIIDYAEPLDVHALQLVSREDAEAAVLSMLKARSGPNAGHFRIDSMSQLELNEFSDEELKRLRRIGDPVGIPKCEEDPMPVKKGFKLKPNATGMYRQFVDRNHKR